MDAPVKAPVRSRPWFRMLAGCAAAAFAALPAVAATDREPVSDSALCHDAIQSAERSTRLPPRLLIAISRVESGRVDAGTKRVEPWPWTINIAGTGYFFETKAGAVAAVAAARAGGQQSIDVGCMQVNLMHHPTAFATLDEAFEPATNVRYAASFLLRLFYQARNWGEATGAYHSQTPEFSNAYRNRIAAAWPDAARYGISVRDPTGSSSRLAVIDPHGVYTPEFRQRVAQAAADRAARGGMAPSRTALSAPPTRLARGSSIVTSRVSPNGLRYSSLGR